MGTNKSSLLFFKQTFSELISESHKPALFITISESLLRITSGLLAYTPLLITRDEVYAASQTAAKTCSTVSSYMSNIMFTVVFSFQFNWFWLCLHRCRIWLLSWFSINPVENNISYSIFTNICLPSMSRMVYCIFARTRREVFLSLVVSLR